MQIFPAGPLGLCSHPKEPESPLLLLGLPCPKGAGGPFSPLGLKLLRWGWASRQGTERRPGLWPHLGESRYVWGGGGFGQGHSSSLWFPQRGLASLKGGVVPAHGGCVVAVRLPGCWQRPDQPSWESRWVTSSVPSTQAETLRAGQTLVSLKCSAESPGSLGSCSAHGTSAGIRSWPLAFQRRPWCPFRSLWKQGGGCQELLEKPFQPHWPSPG